MKKRFAVLLAGMILLLTACGSAGNPKEDQTAPADTGAAVTAPADLPTAPPAEKTSELETVPAAPSGTKALPTIEQGTSAPQEEVPPFFATQDLEGNTVYLSRICAAHSLTMVNLWASWCPPCIRELPDLEALSQKYKEAGLAVVGVLLDAREGGLEDGLALMKQAGVSYLNVMPSAALLNIVPTQYIPVTFFLDSAGQKVGMTIIGADAGAYEEQILGLLP